MRVSWLEPGEQESYRKRYPSIESISGFILSAPNPTNGWL